MDMENTLKVALVVDPGKMTGYGLMDWTTATDEDGYPRAVTFRGGELPMDEFLDLATPWVSARRVDVVVCETFDIRSDTQQKTAGAPLLWSAEQLGVLRFYCRHAGIPLIVQSPSEMKPFDDGKAKTKTKALGWWQDRNPGERGHRRDAASHALLYGVRNRIINPRRFL